MYKNELIPTGVAPAIAASFPLFTVLLADVAAATATSNTIKKSGGKLTFQLVANGSSGAYSASVTMQVSNDNINWMTLGVLSVSGTATTAASDGLVMDAPWAYVRGFVAITGVLGTGATATVHVGG